MKIPVYVWQLVTDYPGADGDDARLPLSEVWLKTHDGVLWMGEVYHHPAAPVSTESVVNLVSIYAKAGIGFVPWCVPTGEDVAREADLASQVLDALAVAGVPQRLAFDFEVEDSPNFWKGTNQQVEELIGRVRAAHPAAELTLIYYQYERFAPVAPLFDVLSTMDYWNDFGTTPVARLESSRAQLAPLGKPIVYGLPGNAPTDELVTALTWVSTKGGGRAVIYRRGSTSRENWRAIADFASLAPPKKPVDTPDADPRRELMAAAASFRGVPYAFGGDGVNTLDCSQYILKVFERAGMPFPAGVRTAESIRQACVPIAWEAAEPGDLLFFEHTYEPDEPAGPDGRVASHVGISQGAATQRMWDAHESVEGTGKPGVGETDVSTDYWQAHRLEARRAPMLSAAQPPVPGVEQAFRVTDDGVRFRAAPGLSGPILRTLSRGARVLGQGTPLVEADGHQWRQVRFGSTVGWVAAEFLRAEDGDAAPAGPPLPADPDHRFSFEALWPYVQASAARYGADPQVLAAIIAQESSFVNWRVHADGTGHGLIGLDDNGLLPDFEQWSGLPCGRGQGAISIPPELQIDYCAKVLAELTREFGSAYNAARVWHRGPSLWQDAAGDNYEALIRRHVQELFG